MALLKPLDNQQLLHSSLYASKQTSHFCLFVCLFVCLFLFVCFSATASVGAVLYCS